MTRRQKRTAAMSLTSMSAAHVASSTFSNGPADDVPALLTRMSTPPCAASVASTTASTSASRVTSATWASTCTPVCFRMASAARSSTSLRRAQITTWQPSWAKRMAVARPSPSLPPVTMATLPVRPRSSMACPPGRGY